MSNPRDRAVQREASKLWRKKNRHKAMLRGCRKRAAHLRLAFDIELTDVPVPDRCPILGIALMFEGPRDNLPSIDRIVPSRGYVKGNVEVISWRANRLKSDASFAEIKAIYKYMKGHIG